MKCTIYILGLNGSKFYVGKTSNIEKRMIQHKRGSGSAWTRKNPVKKLLHVYKDCDPYDEDKYTLKLMDKYGIDNVRGGSYVNPVLSCEDIVSIQKRIWMATDRCSNCGSEDHFISKCNDMEPQEEEFTCEICMLNTHVTEDCQHF
jgi:hypothetical protein